MKPLPGDFVKASRRFVLFLIMLVFLLSQGISQAGGSESVMPVMCRVMPTIEATFPESVEFGDVRPHANRNESYVVSQLQTIKIWSNTAWTLRMKSDSTAGCMTEWTEEGYSDKALSFPLEWKVNGEGDFTEITGHDVEIAEAQSPTQQSGETISLLFRQLITYSDPPVFGSDAYRIQVTFTVSHAY